MKIFITGATGFIGSHLVRRLTAEGHDICCLVRETSDFRSLAGTSVRLVIGDVNDRAALLEGLTGCDCFFHLANLYSMWEPDPRIFYHINVEGTRLAMECALETRVKRVVYVSTVAVFGEPRLAPFDEDSIRGPVQFSQYARTKAAADKLVWEMHLSRGLPLVVIYPSIVLGAGDDKASGQYIRDIVCQRIPGTIFHDSVSTYVAVNDVVDALVRVSVNQHAVGQKYLIGKTMLSGREFVNLIHKISGVPLPIFRFPDWMVLAAAHLFTGLADIIKCPPFWGLSIDAGLTLKNGFRCEGRKAERELGLVYTPIVEALEKSIYSHLHRQSADPCAGERRFFLEQDP